MGLTGLDSIARQVLPQVLPAPRGMVEDSIMYAAADFCDASEVWTDTFQEAIGYGEASCLPTLPSGQRIARLLEVWLGSSRLYPGEYEQAGDEIYFKFPVGQPAIVTVRAAIKPARFAGRLPESIVEEYGDVIAYGALAKIKAMSGQGIEWSDASGAGIALQMYNEGVARAKIAAIRARNGGDILAVGQEYR